MRAPEVPETVEPQVHVTQRSGVHRVDAAGTFRADLDQAAFAEHPQVQRHRWLGDAELALDHGRHCPGGLLPARQELEQAPPDGVGQKIQRRHVCNNIRSDLYKLEPIVRQADRAPDEGQGMVRVTETSDGNCETGCSGIRVARLDTISATFP